MPTTTGLLTLADYEQLPDDGVRRELDEGELVVMTFPKPRHTFAALNFYDALNPWVRSRGLGRCVTDAGFLLVEEPPVLRGPDVAFVRAERVAALDPDNWIQGAPDLAVEVVSPSESAEDLFRKVQQYLQHGSQAVLTIYPRERTVHVHRQGQAIAVVTDADVLEVPELFPGWSIPAADLF
ncbi:MAG: Uma2 family endonuclease [Acidobacteria bacterium]|nr:Uma2 family endonuclease [Acidobacteriota bacterium]